MQTLALVAVHRWGLDFPDNSLPLERKAYITLGTYIALFTIVFIMGALFHRSVKNAIRRQQAIVKETNRKKELLNAALQDAESANRAKTEMMAVLAHELRNPIHAILSLSDLLLAEKLNPGHEADTKSIRANSELMLSILDDVLNHTKIESGKVQFERVTFDIRKVVQEHAAKMAATLESKQLRVICEVDSSVPKLVQGDPTRISQILSHLCSHALCVSSKGMIDRVSPQFDDSY